MNGAVILFSVLLVIASPADSREHTQNSDASTLRVMLLGTRSGPAIDPQRTGIDTPTTERLLRPAFGAYRIEWPGDQGIAFYPSHGDWIRILRRSRFDIEDLIEVWPPAGAATSYPFVNQEWARNWPCEEIWKARKRL